MGKRSLIVLVVLALVVSMALIGACAPEVEPEEEEEDVVPDIEVTIDPDLWADRQMRSLKDAGVPMLEPEDTLTVAQFVEIAESYLGEELVADIGVADTEITRAEMIAALVTQLDLDNEAAAVDNPVIPANDGMDVPDEYMGALTVAARPSVQLLTYRQGRMVDAEEPATMAEAAYALYHTKTPPRQGGRLIRGREVEPAQLNTILTTSGGTGTLVAYAADRFIGRTECPETGELVYYPRQLKVIPSIENGLIQDLGDGRMEVTYKFREDMKWHDGEDVTAHDAVFMQEVVTDPRIPAVSRVGFDIMEEMEVVSDYELRVVYSERYPYAHVGTPQYETFFLMPEHVFGEAYEEAKETDDYAPFREKMATTAVFTGQWKLTDIHPGEEYTFEAFEDHWLGRPNIDRLHMRVIFETDVLLTSLLEGELDFHIIYNIDQAIALEPRLPADVGITYRPRVNHQLPIALNLEDPDNLGEPHPILGDIEVRQAMLHAIDRQMVNEVVYGGRNEVSHAWIYSEQHPHHNPDVIHKYPYDPERAEELLEEAGWEMGDDGIRERDGEPLEIEMVTIAGREGYEECQQLFQAQWREVGIELVINNMPWGVFTSEYRPYGDFDTAFASWGYSELTDPVTYWHSDGIPTEENAWSGLNYWRWDSEENDRILEEIQVTVDEDRRRELQGQQLEVWTEELPMLPFLSLMDAFPGKVDLVNFFGPDWIPSHTGNMQFWYWEDLGE